MRRRRRRRNAYRKFVVKSEGKRPLGRPRRRWVDKIKMDLREIGWDVAGSGQGPVEGSCERSDELSDSTKYGEILNWMSD
jgi:hypothetical protein